MLQDPLIHCDETHLQVLKSDKPATSDHWMWVRASGPPGRRIILFDYDRLPGEVLSRCACSRITVASSSPTGYAAYDGVAEARKLLHAGCMAHCRRKFDEAKKVQPDSAPHAKAALDFIGRLSVIERPLWDPQHPLTCEQRLAVRQRCSVPIMTEFHGWLETLAPKVLPQSKLGKAVHYALGQWRKLAVFLTHGEVPMTNNLCENAIRPFVVGRKGWLFSDTVKGAVASANLYSLVETAKANGIEPHAYLTQLFTRLPAAASVEDFEALLPWNLGAGSRAPPMDRAIRRNLSKGRNGQYLDRRPAPLSRPPQVPSPRCPGARGSSQSISPASWSMPPAISMKNTTVRCRRHPSHKRCARHRNVLPVGPMKIPASCGTVPSVRTTA